MQAGDWQAHSGMVEAALSRDDDKEAITRPGDGGRGRKLRDRLSSYARGRRAAVWNFGRRLDEVKLATCSQQHVPCFVSSWLG